VQDKYSAKSHESVQKSTKYSRNQKWTIASFSLGTMLEGMDVMLLSFALASIIAELHISSAAGGMIGWVTTIGMVVGSIVFGTLADTFGRVRTFTYTLIIVGVATGLLFFANNIYLIYLLRFLVGLGNGGEYGTGVTLVVENFKKKKVATLLGVIQTIGEVGVILAALLASLILPRFGWHALFLLGLLPIIFSFFVRMNLKENPDFVKRAEQTPKKFSLRKFAQLFANPRTAWQTVAIIVMVMVENAGYYGLMNWLPSIMQHKLGISSTKSMLWTISTIVGVCLGMIVFGKMLDLLGPRVAFTVFNIGAAIFVYTILAAWNSFTLLLATTFVGFFAGATYMGFGVIVSKLYPTSIRDTANSFIMSCGKAIGGFSSVVIGFLMDHSTLMVILVFLSVIYLVSTLALFTIPSLKNMKTDEIIDEEAV
jgi:MFS family permease